MADTPPRVPANCLRAERALKGTVAPFIANSSRFGRSRSPMLMSLNGGLPLRVTTRIISSGVTPLAQSVAMNEPAEVPT